MAKLTRITQDGKCGLCGDAMEVADASVMYIIQPDHDPERKCRIEIRLECAGCGFDYRAFVAARDFVDADQEPGDHE